MILLHRRDTGMQNNDPDEVVSQQVINNSAAAQPDRKPILRL
jgi:hypothetical protein